MAKKKTAKKTARPKAVKRAVKRAPARAAKKTAKTPGEKTGEKTVKKVAKKVAKKKAASRSRAKANPARNVAVVVGGSDRSRLEKVASQLRRRGMTVDSVLAETGVITGTSSKKPSAFSNVEGVNAVEEIPSIQLPPPGSDTPQ